MSIYEFEVVDIQGNKQKLDLYRGKVMLIVNTATKCGYADQFRGLQRLYETYREQGFIVLGFPCDQFLHQELAEESEIAAACKVGFGVSFPLFSKIHVKGKDAHPLFQYLCREAPGLWGTKSIKWNFTKFLVNRQGRVVRRYAPRVTPEQIEADLRKWL